MKRVHFLFGAVLSVTSSLTSQTTGFLLKHDFNRPTEVTFSYPPSPGVPFQRFDPVLTAWANNGGQITISYSEGFGLDHTGGLHVMVAKQPLPVESGYLSVEADGLKIPVTSPDLIGSYIGKLQLHFAANIPVGKTVDVHLVVAGAPAELRSRAYPSRLILIKAQGTGSYVKHRISLADSLAGGGAPFLRFVQDCLANGANEINVRLAWHMPASGWLAGDEFTLDNIYLGPAL